MGVLMDAYKNNVEVRLLSASDFGIWQRCQISRLFLEDGQDGQVIDLAILPR
jgi:hypothetical protein